MEIPTKTEVHSIPWNKGKLVGPKPPLKLKEIWAIRIRLQLDHQLRQLALFSLAIDSKLRACDLVGLRVHDVVQGSHLAARAIVMQQKNQRLVLEITAQTRDAFADWFAAAHLKSEHFLFPSSVTDSPYLSTRQYSGIVSSWGESIGPDPAAYGTHSMRRIKPALIYRRTKNLRAVQLQLGHTKLESTVDTSGSRSTTRSRSQRKLRCSLTVLDCDRQNRRSQSDFQPFVLRRGAALIDPEPPVDVPES